MVLFHKKRHLKEKCKQKLSEIDLEKSSLSKTIYKDIF